MAETTVDRVAPPPPETAGTGELVREALDDARELVRLEVALAREEFNEELGRAKRAAVGFGLAASLAIAGLAVVLAAIALATDTPWLVALVIGLGVLCLAAGAGLTAWKTLPQRPLAETKDRIEADVRQLKDRIA